MDPAPSPWPRRFLNALPSMPDSLWVGFVLLMVFLLGLAAGLTWCLHPQQQTVQRLAVQHQLDALDKRLKAVESQ